MASTLGGTNLSCENIDCDSSFVREGFSTGEDCNLHISKLGVLNSTPTVASAIKSNSE